MVITRHISTHITTVAEVPEPTQNIIIGPSAIFGKLLSMIRYGSITRLSFSLHQSIIAIATPSTIAMTKPIIVSYREVHICKKRFPFTTRSASVTAIRDGLEKKNGSIAPVAARISHNPKKDTKRVICQKMTIILSFLSLFKYFSWAFDRLSCFFFIGKISPYHFKMLAKIFILAFCKRG